MSSGAYVVRAPSIDPAVVAFFVGAAADNARKAAEEVRDFASDVKKIRADHEKRMAELDAKTRRIHESIIRVTEEMEALTKTMGSRVFNYETVSDRLSPQEKIESTQVSIDVSGEELLCMEINPDTGEAAYAVLDYSDALAIENARNSSQYKKLAMASDVMKKLLVMASADKSFFSLRQTLIDEINKMLDDDSIDFEQFRKTVTRKLQVLEEKSAAVHVSPELWRRYCALCARAGRQPEAMGEKELEKEIDELLTREITADYYAGARKAFFESAKELGMHVEEKYELVSTPGALLVDSEIPSFGLFFTDSSDSFLVEILDTQEGPETEEKKTQHQNMCKKRKQLEALMEQKGYELAIITENDEEYAQGGLQEVRKDRETPAETIRRKRALNGRKAKIRAAGGNQ